MAAEAEAKAEQVDDIMDPSSPSMAALMDQYNEMERENAAAEAESVEPEAEGPAPEPEEPSEEATEQEPTTDAAEGDEEDSAPADDPVEQEADEEIGDDLTRQLDALAELHQVPVESLKGFSSVNDARAALMLQDRTLSQVGQQEYDQWQEYQQRQPAEQQATQPPPQPQAPPVNGKATELDLSVFGDDDEVRGVFEQVLQREEAMKNRLEQLEQLQTQQYQQQIQAQQLQAMERFHRSIDAMKEDRYGNGEKLTPDQERNRARIGDQVDLLIAGHQARGLKVPDIEQLVRRADPLVFGDQIKQQARQEARDEIKKRSSRRLGSPSRSSVKEPSFDSSKSLAEQPNLYQLYHEMEQQG